MAISADDQRFMQAALKEARAAFQEGEVPVGAVIVKNGQILARAHNRVEQQKNATAHAELLAIAEASRLVDNWRLTGCTLYSTLEPCILCAGGALLSRLDRIVYAAKDMRHGACGTIVDVFSPFAIHHLQVEGGVLEGESAQLLKDFFKACRASS